MKKKGQVGQDLASYLVILFAMSILLVAVGYVWTAIDDAWSSSDQIPQESKDIISTQATSFRPIWDTWMAFAIVGYAIMIIILALQIRTHPAFAMLGFIVMIIVAMVGISLSNSYYEFGNSGGDLTVEANQWTITNLVMEKLPLIIVLIGIVFIIVLYAKSQRQNLVG